MTAPLIAHLNLRTGEYNIPNSDFLSLLSEPVDTNNDSYLEALLQLNLNDPNLNNPYNTAVVEINYDAEPAGIINVNIGDSSTNNGFSGDGGTQSNDSELQIGGVNPDQRNDLRVFGNDNSFPNNLLNLTPNLVPGADSRVTLTMRNEFVAWDNHEGITGNLSSPFLFALDGQPDSEGPVNYDIFAAFNRVVGPNRLGSGVSDVTITLDSLPTISINDVTVTEGLERWAELTVSLSEAATRRVTVNYSTIPDTAEAGLDFRSEANQIRFNPGQTSKTIRVPIIDNNIPEADEVFRVNLSNASLNAPIVDGEGIVTITDTIQTSVTATLPTRVENLTLIGRSSIDGLGNTHDNIITGNNSRNQLIGDRGNDQLIGNRGDDTLRGGPGDDLLTGGSGKDYLVYESGRRFRSTDFGRDTITDFGGQDKIVLSLATFTALASAVGNGFSNSGDYQLVHFDSQVANSTAAIVFSKESRTLTYNQNGSGDGLGQGSIFADLPGVNTLGANRFVIEA